MWDLELNADGDVGLARQITLAFRQRILAGQLAQGDALPSTRELAANLGVSRSTVSEAYDMLWTEGYILHRPGAASRVAQGLCLAPTVEAAPAAKPQPATGYRFDFKTGQPDLQQFAWSQWNRLISEAALCLPPESYAYSSPKGYAPLCEQLAAWLLRSRGLTVKPEDVFITSGTTHAFHVLAAVLQRRGCAFAVENPSHPGIRAVAQERGIPLLDMPVDAQGAQVETLRGQAVAAAFVTPSHQYPLGCVLPASRRAALVRLACERDFYIVEDDYDSEFRYAGSPISPVYELDPTRVIYAGTFSKTLFPALRIGFVVLPKALQASWLQNRLYTDVQNPVLEQATLAAFLAQRKMDRHVRRMRRLYGQKREVLLSAVREAFGGAVIPWGDASGLHIALAFPGRRFDAAFRERCAQAGIYVDTVNGDPDGQAAHADKLLLGYGHMSGEQITQGIGALRACMQSETGAG